MNGLSKALLIMLAILYFVSPVDLCPGPIDDIIILLLIFTSRKGASA